MQHIFSCFHIYTRSCSEVFLLFFTASFLPKASHSLFCHLSYSSGSTPHDKRKHHTEQFPLHINIQFMSFGIIFNTFLCHLILIFCPSQRSTNQSMLQIWQIKKINLKNTQVTPQKIWIYKHILFFWKNYAAMWNATNNEKKSYKIHIKKTLQMRSKKESNKHSRTEKSVRSHYSWIL